MSQSISPSPPRMIVWALLALLLFVAAQHLQATRPGSVEALLHYRVLLVAVGGLVGYWLDRSLFPYDRCHLYLEPDDPLDPPAVSADSQPAEVQQFVQLTSGGFGHSMLRRAIVVAACIVCMGLGG